MSASDVGGTANAWRALAELDALLDLPEAERAEQLDRLAAEQPALAEQVRALLAADARAAGILERPVPLEPVPDIAELAVEALAADYAIDEVIGRGGMATVFRAREHKHGRDVVIKVLDPGIAQLYGEERFLQEIRIAATLAHPHIVPLLDSGSAGGLLYYVMPFMDGESLRQRLASGALPLPEAVTILHDLAGALAFAHDHGVVHRDLKPENVFLASGHAYLLDFGIAKLFEERALAVERSLTSPGAPLGTRRYMAPEQMFAAADVDERADVFSWGVLAAEVLAGAPLPVGEPARVAPAVLGALPTLPPSLRALVLACVTTAPEARPGSMHELLRRLDAPDAAPVASAPHGQAVPRRARRLRASFVAMGVLLAAGALWAKREQGMPLVEGRLREPFAVSVLRNETADSALGTMGRYAGDVVTDGLQRLERVQVVPWHDAAQAAERAEREGVPLLEAMGRDVRAGTVIEGAYYRVRDSLRVQARLTDVRSGEVMSVLAPISVPADRPEDAAAQLRDRVMGAVAASRNAVSAAVPALARNPPSFSAYRAFDLGYARYLAQAYDEALVHFRTAHERDRTFTVALLLAARAAWNTGDIATADSLVRAARAGGGELVPYYDASLRFLDALIAGDGARARAAIRPAASIAPNSRAGFDLASSLLNAGFAREAEVQLRRMDPDRGEMRGWSSYWTQRAHADYLLGRHEEERTAAQAMATRFPDRRVAQVLEARALAALGQVAVLDSALARWEALPANVYWSQGAALTVASEEFMRRGDTVQGARYGQRAVAWLTNRLVAEPSDRGHRYWLGNVLYALGRDADARPYLEGIAREFPERLRYRGLAAMLAARRGDRTAALRWLGEPAPHERGLHALFLARIAAVFGEREQAVLSLTRALEHGVETFPWFPASAHRDFAPILDDPRARALLAGR